MKHISTNHAVTTAVLLIALFSVYVTQAGPPPPKAACDAALQAALVTDLNFGDFEGAVAGTITIDTAGTRTTTGPLLAGGTVSAAAYDVWNTLSGCEKRIITVTVPNSITLTGPGSMTADTFTISPANKFKLTAPGVATRVTVGATLNSAAGQASGGYTVPFSVQFNH